MRIDSVAQQVEHNTFNVGVLGSSPSWITREDRKEADATGGDQRKNLRDSHLTHKFSTA